MDTAQQMTTAPAHSCCGGTSQTSLGGSRWGRYVPAWLHGPRGLILGAAVVATVGGAAFGWPWLVAAGVAPILLSLAPCAAMCALGLCMMRKGNKAAAAQNATPNAGISMVAPALLGDGSEPLPPRQRVPKRAPATLS